MGYCADLSFPKSTKKHIRRLRRYFFRNVAIGMFENKTFRFQLQEEAMERATAHLKENFSPEEIRQMEEDGLKEAHRKQVK